MKKFVLESASSVRTPMSPNVKLTVDLLGKSVNPSLYRSMIGSLLYFTASRPDISYSVGVCARYQANPKKSHMTALKRIIKYVKTTAEFGVWYSKDTSDVLARYSNVDWAGNADDRKSTSGGCFYVGNNLVSWMSKNQNSISLSTAEAEYIAAGIYCTQLLWMQKLLHDYGICQEHMLRYLLTCCFGSPIPSNFSTSEILSIGGSANRSFGAYAPHVIKTIIHPLGLERGKLHFLNLLSHGYGFCCEFLKLLVHFLISFVHFTPIFHFFIIENLYM